MFIKTKKSRSDLVLNKEAEEQLKKTENLLMRKRPKRIKGFCSLFFGTGTAKKTAAALLGKTYDKPVYRIGLSKIISKYIGETEKNLDKLFSKAEDKGWILFFDEADALFSKRTNVKDSHDRYANMEINYLLKKIQEHPGLVILAANLKNNIDKAFIRRFHTIVDFTPPTVAGSSKKFT